MPQNEFDNIKNKLEGYRTPMDVNLEWEDFSSKSNKRKKGYLFFFSIGLLSILVFYQIYSHTTSVHSDQDVVLSDAENSIEKNIKQIDIKSNADELQLKLQAVKIEKNKKEAFIKPFAEPEESITIEATSSKNNIMVTNSNHNSKAMTIGQSVIRQNNSYPVNEPLTIKAVSSSKPLISESLIDIDRLTIFSFSSLPSLLITKVKSTNGSSFPALDLGRNIESQNLSNGMYTCRIYSSFGIGKTLQSYSARNTDFSTFADKRNSSEQSLETYSYSMGVDINLSKKLFINPFLSYHTWYDRIEHKYDLSKNFIIEDVLLKKITYKPSDLVEEIVGDTTLIGSQTFIVDQINNYKTSSIGLNLGCIIIQLEKFDLGVIAGANWNVYSRVDAKYHDGSNIGGPLVDSNDGAYNFGMSIQGGIVLSYRFLDRWGIQLRPTFSSSTQSILKDDQGLNASILRYGLMGNVFYQF